MEGGGGGGGLGDHVKFKSVKVKLIKAKPPIRAIVNHPSLAVRRILKILISTARDLVIHQFVHY